MKIALFSLTLDERTGWGRYTKDFCMSLYEKGIAFELHLPLDSKRFDVLFPVKYDLPSFKSSFGFKMWNIPLLWLFTKAIKLEGSLIHSLIEFPYAVCSYWLARKINIPYGVTLHGTYSVKPLTAFSDAFYFKKALKDANFLISVSHYTAKRVKELVGDLASIKVIHNGIRYKHLAKEATSTLTKALPFIGKGPLILSVGALKPRKGHDVLIRAFSMIADKVSSFLVIVGSGNKDPYLKMIYELGLDGKVFIIDYLKDEELTELYRLCDLFILLPRVHKRVYFEGFGLVYLEASSFGKPVVGTLTGGVPEAVVDGETGILVPPDDPLSAARAMLTLLENKELARRMGETGQEWAQKHDWNTVIDSYIEVYKSWQKSLASSPEDNFNRSFV